MHEWICIDKTRKRRESELEREREREREREIYSEQDRKYPRFLLMEPHP